MLLKFELQIILLRKFVMSQTICIAQACGWAKNFFRRTMETVLFIADAIDIGPNGGVTVSTESLTVKRHAGV